MNAKKKVKYPHCTPLETSIEEVEEKEEVPVETHLFNTLNVLKIVLSL